MKKTRSISIDSDIIGLINKQAKLESRNFSGMIELMAKKYLNIK